MLTRDLSAVANLVDIATDTAIFPTRVFCVSAEGVPLGIRYRRVGSKKQWWATGPNNKFDDIFSHVDRMHQRDGRTDRHRATAKTALTHSVARIIKMNCFTACRRNRLLPCVRLNFWATSVKYCQTVFFSFKYHFSFNFGGVFVLVLTFLYVNVVRLMTTLSL